MNNTDEIIKPFVMTTAVTKLAELMRMTDKPYKVVQGGTSASKTFGILAILIQYAIVSKDKTITVVAESYRTLERGAVRDFKNIMIMMDAWDEKRFNKSSFKYVFESGTYIEFIAGDSDRKMRGARRDVLYMNEANAMSFELFNELNMRNEGDTWIDFNPTNQFWAHTELLQLEKDNTCFIKLTYKDNEALSQKIVDKIESMREKGKTSTMWANQWKVYGLGEVGSLEGACIPVWGTVDCIPPEAQLLCVGVDWGWNDPMTAIALYRLGEKYIFDEVFYESRKTPTDLHKRLTKEGLNNATLYADHRPDTINELNNINVALGGSGSCMSAHKKDGIYNGIVKLNEFDIYITKRSKNLMSELQGYVWDKDNFGREKSEPKKNQQDHAIDSMRYALLSFLKNPSQGSYHLHM